mmetsp:Transcript_50744/g.100973  ORF Transcript_50744/g.100973 Transcript_50744/m.100973 type:complete len:228 (+) Transcript_50744:575-1258(+)
MASALVSLSSLLPTSARPSSGNRFRRPPLTRAAAPSSRALSSLSSTWLSLVLTSGRVSRRHFTVKICPTSPTSCRPSSYSLSSSTSRASASTCQSSTAPSAACRARTRSSSSTPPTCPSSSRRPSSRTSTSFRNCSSSATPTTSSSTCSAGGRTRRRLGPLARCPSAVWSITSRRPSPSLKSSETRSTRSSTSSSSSSLAPCSPRLGSRFPARPPRTWPGSSATNRW